MWPTPSALCLVSSHFTVKDSGATELLSDIESLLTISCEDKNFPCHEVILRARSPVIDKMFQQEMKEKHIRKLTAEDVGRNTMDAVLEFITLGK